MEDAHFASHDEGGMNILKTEGSAGFPCFSLVYQSGMYGGSPSVLLSLSATHPIQPRFSVTVYKAQGQDLRVVADVVG